jgi:hypothetical protein
MQLHISALQDNKKLRFRKIKITPLQSYLNSIFSNKINYLQYNLMNETSYL